MNVGDTLDALALGNQAIDIKTLIQKSGYVIPQGSVAKLPKIPAEILAEIERIEASKLRFGSLNETKVFDCPYCGEHNSSQWRVDHEDSDTEFLVCGTCSRVVEVA